MKSNSALAILAVAALSAPMVVQAQDPMSTYKRVLELAQAGNQKDALALCDQIIKKFGDPKSRMAAQFLHFVPFYQYQKGNILFNNKQYAEAYEAFKALTDNAAFQKKDLRDRAKQIPGNPEGYEPMLTMAQFYKGYCLYQLAAGDGKNPGDPAKFDEAIPELEAYLKLYEAGKVSKDEKRKKMDGSICFILMQSYIRKPQTDFKKAEEYLSKSQHARAPLPDDLAMSGLESVVAVATKKPEYIDWCYRIVTACPESFNLDTARMAPFSGKMFNYGMSSTKIGSEFLQAGKVEEAAGAFRSANAFFGLVSDSPVVTQVLNSYVKQIKLDPKGKFKVIPDNGTGVKHNPGNYKKLIANYKKITDAKTYPEAAAVLQQGNMGYLYGSNRLIKAAYHIMVDRYPDFHQEKAGKMVSMKDQNISQYANLCRATGDVAAADEYAKKVDLKNVDDNSRVSGIANKMNDYLKEENWEAAITTADELIQALGDDKKSLNYIAAVNGKLSANYKLAIAKKSPELFRTVIEQGEALLNGPEKTLESDALTPENRVAYSKQASFFVLHAYHELAGLVKDDRKANLDKCIELAQKFLTDFSEGMEADKVFSPNTYYFAIDALLKRQGFEDDDKKKKTRKLIVKYCEELAKHWPGHDLTPVCQLIAGQVLTSDTYANEAEENREKDRGLVLFEKAVDAALALDKKNYDIAGEALFLLYSYAPEFTREGEDDKAKSARIQGYFNRFMSDVYPKEGDKYTRPGNANALKLVTTALGRASSGNDPKAFEAALETTRGVIVSEAAYGMEKNVNDPELEKTINTYASNLVDGSKKLLKKEYTMDERVNMFKNFKGIPAENKYASAILRMCALRAVTNEQVAVRRSKELDDAAKKAKVKELQDKVDAEMDAFTRQYRPDDLTNYICLQVGDRMAADAADRFKAGSLKENLVDTTLSYYDKIVQRGGEYTAEGQLGRAKILSVSSQDARRAESAQLFQQLSEGSNPTVATAALVGVTRLNAQNKDYAAVVKSAKGYCERNKAMAARPETVEMHMLYADALLQTGDDKSAQQVYINIYNQNMGSVGVSAPACKALMELYWNRNTPASGDRAAKTFKPSDRWRAWNTGANYVRNLKPSESKFSPDDRDAFRAVEELVKTYNTSPVQQEEAANKSYAKASKSK